MTLTFDQVVRSEPPMLKVKFCWRCNHGLRKGFALQLKIDGKMRAIHRKCASGWLSCEERAKAQLFQHGRFMRAAE